MFLSNAIKQQVSWTDQKIEVTPNWYLMELEKKIHSINWQQTAEEVHILNLSISYN